MKFIEYLLVLVNIIKKDRINGVKNRSIKKSRNKLVKISAKLKSRNLPKSKSENLSKYKNFIKFQNTSVIEKLNFPTPNTRKVFTTLR